MDETLFNTDGSYSGGDLYVSLCLAYVRGNILKVFAVISNDETTDKNYVPGFLQTLATQSLYSTDELSEMLEYLLEERNGDGVLPSCILERSMPIPLLTTASIANWLRTAGVKEEVVVEMLEAKFTFTITELEHGDVMRQDELLRLP